MGEEAQSRDQCEEKQRLNVPVPIVPCNRLSVTSYFERRSAWWQSQRRDTLTKFSRISHCLQIITGKVCIHQCTASVSQAPFVRKSFGADGFVCGAKQHMFGAIAQDEVVSMTAL